MQMKIRRFKFRPLEEKLLEKGYQLPNIWSCNLGTDSQSRRYKVGVLLLVSEGLVREHLISCPLSYSVNVVLIGGAVWIGSWPKSACTKEHTQAFSLFTAFSPRLGKKGENDKES